jgi:hypothetical protein
MKTSTKWIIAIGTVVAMLGGGALTALAVMQPTTRDVGGNPGDPEPTSTPPTTGAPVALPDGTLVGRVTIDPSAPFTLTIDEVEILTGQAAHDAAVDAGIITEDEDLPNDMFIANPDDSATEASLTDEAVVEMLSGETPGTFLTVTVAELAALIDGSYSGAPVYGVAAGEPILMTITIESGAITALQAVYLP